MNRGANGRRQAGSHRAGADEDGFAIELRILIDRQVHEWPRIFGDLVVLRVARHADDAHCPMFPRDLATERVVMAPQISRERFVHDSDVRGARRVAL